MKQLLIALAFALSLSITVQAAAQKHRHHVAGGTLTVTTTTAVSDSTDEGITAYSDTTLSEEDSVANKSVYVTMDDDYPFNDHQFEFLTNMMDKFGGIFAFFVVLLVFLFLGAPFIIVALVLWLVFRNRNRKYQLAEKAMETGQPLPEELLKTERQSNEFLWRKGIKNAAVGIGLVIFFYYLGADPLVGIGWLVTLYGVGQAIIAKTSGPKRDKFDKDSDDYGGIK
jgi:hypothetical protein